MNKNQIVNNLKKIITLDTKKIIIVGLSEECFMTAKMLHELKKDLYAYASDDLSAVARFNKNNIIFAEKWFGDDIEHLIKVLPFGEALLLSNVLYLIASKHYEKQLTSHGYKKNIDFFAINEVIK